LVGAASFGPHITVHVWPQLVTVQPVAGHCTAHTVALPQSTVVVDEVCACTLQVSLAAHVASQVWPAGHCTLQVVPPPVHVKSHGSASAHWQVLSAHDASPPPPPHAAAIVAATPRHMDRTRLFTRRSSQIPSGRVNS
jgi:hypothetical protein